MNQYIFFMAVIKKLNHEKSLQALSNYGRMEAVELEKEIDYEFLELNKKRHATKHFTDKPVDPKDVRTAIEIATLAPSAHNSQPWKFVVVREKNAELAKLAYGSNFEQVSSAPVTIALFTDTDLAKRARKIARVGGANNFSEEQLQYFMKNLPAEFARYSEQQVSDYLALNAGLVAMNLVLALTDQGIGSNLILGLTNQKSTKFWKSKTASAQNS